MRRPYLIFLAADVPVGFLGPFHDGAAAAGAQYVLLAAETASLAGVDMDAVADELCIPAFYEEVRVVDLTLDEIRALAG